MKSYLIVILSILSTLLACKKRPIEIYALCEKGKEGTYTIKWETYPELDDAIIEIYASGNDSVFSSQPIIKTNVNKYIVVIDDTLEYKEAFFKLKIGNTYSDIISNRFYKFENLQNFRDLGGYRTYNGSTTKWGKLFRSGEFFRVNEQDKKSIGNLQLKTIIDLRPREVQARRKDELSAVNRYSIYIKGPNSDSIAKEILENRFLKGNAIIYMQDLYEHILLNNSKEIRAVFDIMSDPNNYPLAYHCTVGKDQSGIISYFLLQALGIPTDMAERDYMLSNREIDKIRIVKGVSNLSESQQETFTQLTRTDIAYLKYALSCVKKEYGSLDNYTTNELGLTKEKKEKLRELLLY